MIANHLEVALGAVGSTRLGDEDGIEAFEPGQDEQQPRRQQCQASDGKRRRRSRVGRGPEIKLFRWGQTAAS